MAGDQRGRIILSLCVFSVQPDLLIIIKEDNINVKEQKKQMDCNVNKAEMFSYVREVFNIGT